MASTYSDLKFELIGTGEQSGTWGTTTNTNLGTAIEEAITGSADVTFASGTVTLTLTNTNASQTARNLRLNLTGTSGGAQDLVVPAIEKFYLVNNGCADTITVKNSGGTGVAVPAGKAMLVFNDGTNVVDAVNHFNTASVGTLTLTNALAVAQGGTGATSASGARTSLGLGTIATQDSTAISVSGGTVGGTTIINTSGNLTATGTATSSGTLNITGNLQLDGASGTSGEVLVSQGSGVTPIWGSGFPSGGIIMWSGSIASIPSGWYLCDGTNGTPNLKDRMVIGAGNLYSVDGSGGSKDASVVSHTHTITDAGHNHFIANTNNTSFNANPTLSASTYMARANAGGVAVGNSETYSLQGTATTPTVGLSSTKTTGITIDSAGSSGTDANLPPYYALAFIMKA